MLGVLGGGGGVDGERNYHGSEPSHACQTVQTSGTAHSDPVVVCCKTGPIKGSEIRGKRRSPRLIVNSLSSLERLLLQAGTYSSTQLEAKLN